jgi:hypothetical protein
MKRLLAASLLLIAALAVWVGVRRTDPQAPAVPARPTPGAPRPAQAPLPPPELRHETASPDAAADPALEAEIGEAGGAPEPPASSGESDPVQHVLFGRVTDPSGTPLAQALVGLTDDLGARVHDRTDADGGYSISGLHAGRWWLRTWEQTHRELLDVVQIAGDSTALRKDLVLEPVRAVIIRLVDSQGRPFFDVLRKRFPSGIPLSFVATREPPPERLHDVRGRLNAGEGPRTGRFEWDPGEGGRCGYLEVQDPRLGWVSLVFDRLVFETKALGADARELTFVLDPERLDRSLCSLRWRFVDAETGEPLLHAGGDANTDESSRFLPAARDPDGRVILEHLSPGRLRISLRVEGHEGFTRTLVLTPGEARDLGTIALDRETWIRGRVVDGLGEPVGVHLACARIEPGDPFAKPDVQGWTTESRPDGTFEVGGLGRGKYLLRTVVDDEVGIPSRPMDAKWVSSSHVVSTLGGSVEDLVLRLEPACLLVFIVSDKACSSWRFRVTEDSGFVIRSGRFYGLGPRRLKLPPGRYGVVLSDEDGREVSNRSVLLSDQPMFLEVQSE